MENPCSQLGLGVQHGCDNWSILHGTQRERGFTCWAGSHLGEVSITRVLSQSCTPTPVGGGRSLPTSPTWEPLLDSCPSPAPCGSAPCAPAQPASFRGGRRREVAPASLGQRVRIQLDSSKPGCLGHEASVGSWPLSLVSDPSACPLGPCRPRRDSLHVCEVVSPSQSLLTGPVRFRELPCAPLPRGLEVIPGHTSHSLRRQRPRPHPRSCLRASLLPGLPSALALPMAGPLPAAPGNRPPSLTCRLPAAQPGTSRNRLLFIQKLSHNGLCGPSSRHTALNLVPMVGGGGGTHRLSQGRGECPPPAGVELLVTSRGVAQPSEVPGDLAQAGAARAVHRVGVQEIPQ